LPTASVMTKNKITILSTRPLDATVVEKAVAAGIHIEVVSFINTSSDGINSLLEKIVDVYTRQATVVFTSMNAVEVVAKATAGRTTRKPDWNIFCIGSTTCELAATHFGETAITGTADNALALADVIIQHKKEQPVVFFCGNIRRNELPDRLKQHNIPVKEVVVYNTLPTPVKVDKQYNGILFFSPSAVISFFSENTLPAQTVLFAIGTTTADTLKEYSGNTIITADKPGKNSLAELAIDYFKT
jgi:uroporphyrinogen-III synthase